jgi:hypothetical protein
MFQYAQNLLTNYTVNDFENKWQGDEISPQKDHQVTRLMFHNIRNLPIHGPEGVEMFVHAQASLEVDIQAFSEHCLDTTKYQVFHTLKEIVSRTSSSQATIQLDSSSESATHQYKPGGTGILLLGRIANQLEPQGKGGDSLGRWSYVHLRRRNLPPLTIVSIYQVCPRPTNILGKTAYHQQQRALNMAGRSIHPRQAFMEDISQFVTTLRQKNHAIILGGDFNESFEDKNSGLLQLATTHNMVDPFIHRYPHHPEFGTHLNGRRRIDVVLVTPCILPGLQAVGYAPYDYSTPSDHRPLVLEFKTDMLLGTHTDAMEPMHHRETPDGLVGTW